MSFSSPGSFVRVGSAGLMLCAFACGSVELYPDASSPDARPSVDAMLPEETPIDAGSADAAPVDADVPIDGVVAVDAIVAADAVVPDAVVPTVGYDIAYINELTLNGSSGSIELAGFMVVVNTGAEPIDLSTTEVLSFSDDSALVGFSLSHDATSTTVLQSGEAAGELSSLAFQRIVSSGLATEPRVDTVYGFDMSFTNIPANKLDLEAQAVLRIEGKTISLPFTIHFSPDAATDFSATRVSLPN